MDCVASLAMTHRAVMAEDAREPDIDGHAKFDANDPES
jgi:hypothetical protein